MTIHTAIHEGERLAALDRYDILDTPPEESFDRITRLVCRLFDVPMSTVTLLDGHRQWFKSRAGVSACETARGPALCSIAIEGPRPLVVPDTLADERFARNPFVTGEPHLRFYAGAPLRTPEGHAVGTLCAMDTKPRVFPPEHIESLMDLASVVMSELELRRLAATDALTGALSRRAFREAATRAAALATRHRHDLACILFDIDRFKGINDGYGHAAGDRVLQAATDACRTHLRASDLIGRMGGEEFAILLPLTGRADALSAAEKIRAAFAQARVPGEEGLSFTASFGVSALDRSVRDVDALLDRADAALYAAKAEGRNRCRAWEPVASVEPSIRRRVLKGGRITFNGGRSTIDCTVRSLSEAGAGLDVVSAAGIPDRFKLQIEADGWSRLCRIAEKRDRHLEVAFE